jgi:hypothetical protein
VETLEIEETEKSSVVASCRFAGAFAAASLCLADDAAHLGSNAVVTIVEPARTWTWEISPKIADAEPEVS